MDSVQEISSGNTTQAYKVPVLTGIQASQFKDIFTRAYNVSRTYDGTANKRDSFLNSIQAVRDFIQPFKQDSGLSEDQLLNVFARQCKSAFDDVISIQKFYDVAFENFLPRREQGQPRDVAKLLKSLLNAGTPINIRPSALPAKEVPGRNSRHRITTAIQALFDQGDCAEDISITIDHEVKESEVYADYMTIAVPDRDFRIEVCDLEDGEVYVHDGLKSQSLGTVSGKDLYEALLKVLPVKRQERFSFSSDADNSIESIFPPTRTPGEVALDEIPRRRDIYLAYRKRSGVIPALQTNSLHRLFEDLTIHVPDAEPGEKKIIQPRPLAAAFNAPVSAPAVIAKAVVSSQNNDNKALPAVRSKKASAGERELLIIHDCVALMNKFGVFLGQSQKFDSDAKNIISKHSQWLNKYKQITLPKFVENWIDAEAGKYSASHEGQLPHRDAGEIEGYDLLWKTVDDCLQSRRVHAMPLALFLKRNTPDSVEPDPAARTQPLQQNQQDADEPEQKVIDIDPAMLDAMIAEQDEIAAARPLGQVFAQKADPAHATVQNTLPSPNVYVWRQVKPAVLPRQQPIRRVQLTVPDFENAAGMKRQRMVGIKYDVTVDTPADAKAAMKNILQYMAEKRCFPRANEPLLTTRQKAFWAEQEKWLVATHNMGIAKFILRSTREMADQYRQSHDGKQPHKLSGPIDGFEDYDWGALVECYYKDSTKPRFEDVISKDVHNNPVIIEAQALASPSI